MESKLRPYSAYRDDTPDWLGRIPKHWRLDPAWSVMRERKIKNEGLVEQNVLSLSYGRIIRRDTSGLKGLLPASFESYQILAPGNVVMRTTDMQNDRTSLRFGYVRERGIITSAYMALEANGDLLPEYMYRYLHTLDTLKVFYGMGSGLRQSIDFSDLKRLPLPVPPPGEQEVITRYLNWFDDRANHLIRAKQQLISLLNEQKQAIIQQAVTRGLEPDVPMKPSGVDWLGDVPVHWDVLPMKRVLRRLVDCEHKTAPAVDRSQYVVARTSSVKDGRYRPEGSYFTSETGFTEWTKREVPRPGDILFTREAPAGEACLVPSGINLCLGQRVVLLRVDRSRYDADFAILMIYGGPPAAYVRMQAQGSTVPHFNMSDIAAMFVLVPPIEEQANIVQHVHEHTRVLDQGIERTTREIDLIREYRTRLISDVVTGKLDVRGATVPEAEDDESDFDLDGRDDEEFGLYEEVLNYADD